METFEELCRLEPRLWALLERARSLHDDGRRARFCATDLWYAEIKPRLLRLVGWDAEAAASALLTEEAYELAYDTIYAVLPACRNCNCLRRRDNTPGLEEEAPRAAAVTARAGIGADLEKLRDSLLRAGVPGDPN